MTHLKEINYDKSEYVKLLSQVIEKVKELSNKREAEIKAWKEDDENLSKLIDQLWTECYDYWVSNDGKERYTYVSFGMLSSWSRKSAVKFETVDKVVTTTERRRRTKPLPFWQWLFTLDTDYVTETVTKTEKVQTGNKESREEHRARLEEEFDIKSYTSKYDEYHTLVVLLTRYTYKPSLSTFVYNQHICFLEEVEDDLKRVLASAEANYTIDSSQFVKYTKYLTDEVSVT